MYEQQADSPVLIKKRIKRTYIEEQSAKSMLADLDRQIQEAASRYKAELNDMHKFHRLNMLDNMFSNLPKKESSKMNLKSSTSQAASVANIFSRTNNNLPTAFKNIVEIKLKVQIFILIWMRDNVDLDAKTIETLLRDSQSREVFFKENQDLFELVLDTILKRPQLYAKIKEFVFDKKLDDQAHIFTQDNPQTKKEDEKLSKEASVSTATRADSKHNQFPGLQLQSKNLKGSMTQDRELPFLKTTVIGAKSMVQIKKGRSVQMKAKRAYYDQLRATANNFTCR